MGSVQTLAGPFRPLSAAPLGFEVKLFCPKTTFAAWPLAKAAQAAMGPATKAMKINPKSVNSTL
jgi:hypothetical protein